MAGSDQEKQFLTLIRGFATESSQGERRIVDLKKRINELRSEIIAANTELEDAKRLKETTEQELRGYEVELAVSEASIQTLEARICLIQDEVLVVGSDLEALKVLTWIGFLNSLHFFILFMMFIYELVGFPYYATMKNEEGALRDDFIEKMFEMNAKIRKFQKTLVYAFHGENCSETFKDEAVSINDNVEDAEVARRAIENKLAQIISQTNKEEQEYQAEQIVYKQVQQELIELEEKVSLMEALLKENKEMQELTRQTSEFEETCASLGNELQKRSLCPGCHLDNVEALGGILQGSGGS